MLRSLILNHYYINLKNNPLGVLFNKLYKATCNYFKGLEYKHNIFTQWNAIKLWTVINKNFEKSTTKYLQILIKDLQYL